MENWKKNLLIYWVSIGLICISWLIVIPKESGENSFLGLSIFRWGAILPILIATLIGTVGLVRYDKVLCFHKDLKSNKVNFIIVISTLGYLILSIIYSYYTLTITNLQIKGIFYRILPVVLWWSGVCFQLLFILLKRYHFSITTTIKSSSTNLIRFISAYKDELIIILLIITIFSVLFAPVYHVISYVPGSDFMAHAKQAERIERTKRIDTSYFLYQLYLIFGHRLFPNLTYLDIGVGIITLFTVLLGVLLFVLIAKKVKPFKNNKIINYLLFLLLTLCISIATPASIFTLHKKNLYFGYLGITTYHNPTLILLKPFALLLFLFTINSFYVEADNNPIPKKIPNSLLIFTTAGTTVLGILAKPNFIIALLPALGIAMLLFILKNKPMNYNRSIFGIILPAVVLLLWQYFATYTQDSILRDKAQVIFAPFLVYSREYDLLLLKFFLSILFPLVVYSTYFQNAKKDFVLNFSWLLFGFGCIYTYFFAETGERLQDANFGWSGDITNFILFVSSTIFFFNHWRSKDDPWKNHPYVRVLPWIAFGLHVISGIYWYYSHLYHPYQPWW